MSVWVVMPSIRQIDEVHPVLQAWSRLGYHIALYRPKYSLVGNVPHDLWVEEGAGEHIGWARSINMLTHAVLAIDTDCQWIVAGSDDIWPDPNRTAIRTHDECCYYFRGTLGVMQPTGDRGNDGIIDTAAASAWMGRDFCKRAYGGRGPLCPDYHYYWADTELQQVAIRLGIFWQNPNLIQVHNHWSRSQDKPPAHLERALAHYSQYEKLFKARQKSGFQGHELSPL